MGERDSESTVVRGKFSWRARMARRPTKCACNTWTVDIDDKPSWQIRYQAWEYVSTVSNSHWTRTSLRAYSDRGLWALPPTNDGLLVKPSVSCRIITLSANFSGVPNLTFCVVTTHLVAFGRCRVSQSRSLKLPFGYYFGGSAESTSETNNAPITVMAASNKKVLKFSVNKYSSYSSNYFPE